MRHETEERDVKHQIMLFTSLFIIVLVRRCTLKGIQDYQIHLSMDISLEPVMKLRFSVSDPDLIRKMASPKEVRV